VADSNAAQTAFASGNYGETIRRANSALRTGSLDAATRTYLYIIRGLSRYRTSEPQLAIPDYNEAIALGQLQSQPYAYWDRGLAYQNTGALDLALSDYATALQLNPNLAETYLDRALLYAYRHNVEPATQDVNKAVALLPKNPRNAVVLAQIYLLQGDLAKAFDATSRALEIDPKSAGAYETRADIAFYQGRYDEAVAGYERALTLPRLFYGVYLKRGTAYLRLGDFSAAANDFHHAQRYQSLSAAGAFSLGRLALYMHDYAKADSSFDYAFDHALAPTVRSHVVIWRFLLAMRQGAKPGAETLPHAADAARMPAAWPAPVIAMYLGRITQAQMFAAAKNANPGIERDQLCEAQYYAGEFALSRGQTAPGIAQLREARATCPPNFIETDGAIMHLTDLNA
jgi:tetratricopeptide (TPR) repeat protein